MREVASRREIDNYIRKFEEASGLEIFESTRRRDISETRYLLYYLLNNELDLSDTYISLLCKERGLNRERSSINIGYNKALNYIKQSPRLRGIYRDMHPDKFRKNIEVNDNPVFTERWGEIKDDDLDLLARDIPYERRKEVYERVKLQIKSWSWK